MLVDLDTYTPFVRARKSHSTSHLQQKTYPLTLREHNIYAIMQNSRANHIGTRADTNKGKYT